MGVFVQNAILQNCTISMAKAIVSKAAESKEYSILCEDCRFQKEAGGTLVYFNSHCCGYEALAKELSSIALTKVMLLYIYDDDYWGYYFYHNNFFLDSFASMPLWDGQKYEFLEGNPSLIAEYFGVEQASIAPYLHLWDSSEDEEPEESCWQMADFMEKLGYAYPPFEPSPFVPLTAQIEPTPDACQILTDYSNLPDHYGTLPEAFSIDIEQVDNIHVFRKEESKAFARQDLNTAQTVQLLEETLSGVWQRIEIHFTCPDKGVYVKKLKKHVYRPTLSTLVLHHIDKKMACLFFADKSLTCYILIYDFNAYHGILADKEDSSAEEEQLVAIGKAQIPLFGVHLDKKRIDRGLKYLLQDLCTAEERLKASGMWSPNITFFGGQFKYDQMRRSYGLMNL